MIRLTIASYCAVINLSKINNICCYNNKIIKYSHAYTVSRYLLGAKSCSYMYIIYYTDVLIFPKTKLRVKAMHANNYYENGHEL